VLDEFTLIIIEVLVIMSHYVCLCMYFASGGVGSLYKRVSQHLTISAALSN